MNQLILKFGNGITKLLEKRNSSSSDKLPLDDKNPFERAECKYIAKVDNATIGTDGLIYNKTHKFVVNPIYNNIEIDRGKELEHYDQLGVVVQKWGYGFYHFMCEQLPKILYLNTNINKCEKSNSAQSDSNVKNDQI